MVGSRPLPAWEAKGESDTGPDHGATFTRVSMGTEGSSKVVSPRGPTPGCSLAFAPGWAGDAAPGRDPQPDAVPGRGPSLYRAGPPGACFTTSDGVPHCSPKTNSASFF